MNCTIVDLIEILPDFAKVETVCIHCPHEDQNGPYCCQCDPDRRARHAQVSSPPMKKWQRNR